MPYLSSLETSIAHIIKCYANVLFSLPIYWGKLPHHMDQKHKSGQSRSQICSLWNKTDKTRKPS